ncbi:hypothetical protein CBM2617_B180024 [Cupriavidus taiwanensis]|nr:hypothetical protein CBM2617_B180024 [Cupriavidus taiwanensis]SOZ86891.1 hypothetical protein CBM2618_B200024 [Cupriavidus taiwanensis]SOZ89976.1 hypothetical protein CBM2622_B190024 [Cupriavidus taiwanensis]SOZ94577.1 hypothetical protein CBM2621_B190022 [Cupriavidus taiwanensis]
MWRSRGGRTAVNCVLLHRASRLLGSHATLVSMQCPLGGPCYMALPSLARNHPCLTIPTQKIC